MVRAEVAPAGARRFARRHRAALTVVGSLATAALLVWLLAGRRDEFTDALAAAGLGVLALTALLQIVALVSRSEAWCSAAAGWYIGKTCWPEKERRSPP